MCAGSALHGLAPLCTPSNLHKATWKLGRRPGKPAKGLLRNIEGDREDWAWRV